MPWHSGRRSWADTQEEVEEAVMAEGTEEEEPENNASPAPDADGEH
jgi:hypothetical protein